METMPSISEVRISTPVVMIIGSFSNILLMKPTNISVAFWITSGIVFPIPSASLAIITQWLYLIYQHIR